jgi:hypothetical protein
MAANLRRRLHEGSEQYMTQDILNLLKAKVRKVWAAWTLAPAPSLPQRPQLDGRRGYGDGADKRPD